MHGGRRSERCEVRAASKPFASASRRDEVAFARARIERRASAQTRGNHSSFSVRGRAGSMLPEVWT